MAHLVETMAYAGEVPWHGLGVPVSNDFSPRQMMEKAGVDWSVEKVPSFVRFNGDNISTGTSSLVRSSDGQILAPMVGDNWEPVQNEEAFEFFNEYCLAGDMEMHTAGSLDEGRVVWVLAKVKESFNILGEDQVDSYLLFSNPHKYGKCIDVRFTPIRVVCNNTLTMSLDSVSNNSVRLNHRSAFDPDKVKETLGIASEKFEKYREMAEFLSKKRFDMDSLIQYYNTLFPRGAKSDKSVTMVDDLTTTGKRAFELLEIQPGANFGAGTWWSALNSVTYLTDHELGRSADTRINSAWFGSNQTRKIKAAELAVKMAMAA